MSLCLAELEELIIQLYNSSSVLISWQPPQFPAGVQLDKYIVHYTRTTTATTDMLSGVDAEGNTTVPGSFGIVASLSPGAFYQFWVRADIVESGFHKADIVPTSKTTIYVPGMQTLNVAIKFYYIPCRGQSSAIERWPTPAMSYMDSKLSTSLLYFAFVKELSLKGLL